ncbi:uncharacterized protein LOC136031453 isoform X1 [Artemia franciscana]|uniref:uncharacterized protein LOC136031453 isoform X1 n=1 Tax=Artemia franciscana TaxID=6661 RepID=UPI0032DA9C31
MGLKVAKVAFGYLTKTFCILLLVNTRQFVIGDLLECDLLKEFRCKTGDLCIDIELVQDGTSDCPDNSDEECQVTDHACSCGYPRCIPKHLVMNGYPDCLDGSDEGLSLPCYQEDGLQELLALERKKRNVEDHMESPITPASPSYQKIYSTQIVGERPAVSSFDIEGEDLTNEEFDNFDNKIISISTDDINHEDSEEIFEPDSSNLMIVKELVLPKVKSISIPKIRAGDKLAPDVVVTDNIIKTESSLRDTLVTPSITEYLTTTVLGFDDFSTTIGSTVVIFSPRSDGPTFEKEMMSSIVMRISSNMKDEVPEIQVTSITPDVISSISMLDREEMVESDGTFTQEFENAEDMAENHGSKMILIGNESMLDRELPMGRSLNSGQQDSEVAPAVITAVSEKEARSLQTEENKSFVIVASEDIDTTTNKTVESEEIRAGEIQKIESPEATNISEIAMDGTTDFSVNEDPSIENITDKTELSDSQEDTPSFSEVEPAISAKYTTYTVFKTLFNSETSKILTQLTIVTNLISVNGAGHEVTMTVMPDSKRLMETTTQTFFKSTIIDGRKAVLSSTSLIKNLIAASEIDLDLLSDVSDNFRMKELQSDSTEDLLAEQTTEYEVIDTNELNIVPTPVKFTSNVAEDVVPSNVLVTTLTYATTFFRDGETEIVTSEETITNTVLGTNVLEESTVDVGITFYTTFTYSTTTISDGATYINTREETVSNIVKSAASIDHSMVSPVLPTIPPAETTLFTTVTYFTTSFVDDETIIESSLETTSTIIRNSATPVLTTSVLIATTFDSTEAFFDISLKSSISSNTDILELDKARAIASHATQQQLKPGVSEPTGLITALSRTIANGGTITKYVTDIIGTYINGFYAEIHESTSEVILPSPVVQMPEKTLHSQNIYSAYDFGGATSTYFTTNYYLQEGKILSEVTSTVRVDLGLIHKTLEESRIGILRITHGTFSESNSETVYETQFLGTILDGTYTTVTKSSSSVVPKISSTDVIGVEPTIFASEKEVQSSLLSHIEGSIEESMQDENGEKIDSQISETTNRFGILRGRITTRLTAPIKSKTFTPTIRPLGNRPRPNFLSRLRNSASGTRIDVVAEDPEEIASPFFSRPTSTIIKTEASEQELSTTLKNRFFRPRPSLSSGTEPSVPAIIPRPTFTVSSKTRTFPTFRRLPSRTSLLSEEISSFQEIEGISDPITSSERPTTRRSFTRPTAAKSLTDITTSQTRKTPWKKSSASHSESSLPSSESQSTPSEPITTRPRVALPPKLVFTERLAISQSDSEFRRRALALRNRGKNISPAPSFRDLTESNNRKKRYAPDLYRPGRSPRGRNSRAREIAPSYDYEYEYEYEDEPKTTTKPPRPTRPPLRSSSSRKTSSSSLSFKSRLAAARASSTKAKSPISRFRKPSIESSSSRSSFRSSSTKSRTSTSRTTGRKISSSSKKSSNKVRLDKHQENSVLPTIQPSFGDSLQTLTVTHKIPTETIIPLIEDGETVFKSIITATPSLEVLTTFGTTKIGGIDRLLASEVTATPSIGLTEITQYLVSSSATLITEFTPTVINGRRTSFRHIIPSTVYDIETTSTTIQDPLAQTNFLLQQILLGNLGQIQPQPQQPINPFQNLAGLNQPLPAGPATPVTSFSTRLTSYVTTITEFQSTVLPITLRGIEVKTTLVKSSVNVVTATEVVTETIVNTPIQQVQQNANPLANLLPFLLANQGGLQQPIQTQIAQLPLISQPQSGIAKVSEIKPEQIDLLSTSVVTLHVAGPGGELSSVLHTVLFEGSPSPVTKRQAVFDSHEAVPEFVVPLMVETDRGIFLLPDQYSIKDIDVYIISAINNDAVELGPVYSTDALNSSALKATSDKVKRQSNFFSNTGESEEDLSVANFDFPPIREREYVIEGRERNLFNANSIWNSIAAARLDKKPIAQNPQIDTSKVDSQAVLTSATGGRRGRIQNIEEDRNFQPKKAVIDGTAVRTDVPDIEGSLTELFNDIASTVPQKLRMNKDNSFLLNNSGLSDVASHELDNAPFEKNDLLGLEKTDQKSSEDAVEYYYEYYDSDEEGSNDLRSSNENLAAGQATTESQDPVITTFRNSVNIKELLMLGKGEFSDKEKEVSIGKSKSLNVAKNDAAILRPRPTRIRNEFNIPKLNTLQEITQSNIKNKDSQKRLNLKKESESFKAIRGRITPTAVLQTSSLFENDQRLQKSVIEESSVIEPSFSDSEQGNKKQASSKNGKVLPNSLRKEIGSLGLKAAEPRVSTSIPSVKNRGRGTVRFGSYNNELFKNTFRKSSIKEIEANNGPLEDKEHLIPRRQSRVFNEETFDSSTTDVKTNRGRSRYRPEPRRIQGLANVSNETSEKKIPLQDLNTRRRSRPSLKAENETPVRKLFRRPAWRSTTTELPRSEDEYYDEDEDNRFIESEENFSDENVEESRFQSEENDEVLYSNENEGLESEEYFDKDNTDALEEEEYNAHEFNGDTIDSLEDDISAEEQLSFEDQLQAVEGEKGTLEGEESKEENIVKLNALDPSLNQVTATPFETFRKSFSLRRKDPLEKHLSSIRANANRRTLRPNLKIGKQTVLNVAPSASRAILNPTRKVFRPSNVVPKSYFITSTVPFHSGKKNVRVTLLTSSLTTLKDSDLHLTTDSPQLFNPLHGSETQLLKDTVDLSVSTVSSVQIRPTLLQELDYNNDSEGSGSSDVEFSTEIIETSFIDTTESTLPSTIETPMLEDDLSFVTVVETELRTYSVVVTSVAGTEQVVSTGIEIIPEEVTKTITLGFKNTEDPETMTAIIDDNELPTARFAGAGPIQLVDGAAPQLKEGIREARVSVGASRPNLATKVMSNGVEVIVAGDKKNSLILQNNIIPTPVAPTKPVIVSVFGEGEEVDAEVQSSIEDPSEFTTRTKLTTFTYVSTLFENNQLVTSTKEEVITEVVTDTRGLLANSNMKTYFVTETKTQLAVVNGQTVTNTKFVVTTEVVPNDIPILSGSMENNKSVFDDFSDEDGPIIATKTFFTTSTMYTTIFLEGKTVTKSRIEVSSSVVLETITDGLAALKESLFGFEQSTAFIEPTQVVSTVPPSMSISVIPNNGQLNALKESFLSTQVVPTVASSTGISVIPNNEQLNALKESFLSTMSETSDPSLEPFGEAEIEPSQIDDYAETSDEISEEQILGVVPSLQQGTKPLLGKPPIQPVASVSVLLEPTIALGLGGKPQEVQAGETVIAVTNSGSVIVVPTEIIAPTPSPSSEDGSTGGLINLLSIPSLSTIGTLGLSAIAQSLVANGGGGLNIQLGPVFNAVSGLVSGGLALALKRNDTAENPIDFTLEKEPNFIPIGAIARPSESRVPQEGIPLVPGAPGSPLLRPGAGAEGFRWQSSPPGMQIKTPDIVLFKDSPQRRNNIQNNNIVPPSIFNSPKSPVTFRQELTGPDQPRQLPPLFPNDPLLFPQQRLPVTQSGQSRPPLFPPNLMPDFSKPEDNLPNKVEEISPPVIFKPVEDPRKPIPVPGPGSIIPGPNGPVRLVPVVGGKPPKGVEGTVFIRPVPEIEIPPVRKVETTPFINVVEPSRDLPSVPLVTATQPSRNLPSAPSMVPFIPSVVTIVPSVATIVAPNVQTIASIEGDNRIVKTNVVSNGKTMVIQPTETGRIRPAGQVVFPSPGLVLFPEDAVIPSTVRPNFEEESSEADGEEEQYDSIEKEDEIPNGMVKEPDNEREGSDGEYDYDSELDASTEPELISRDTNITSTNSTTIIPKITKEENKEQSQNVNEEQTINNNTKDTNKTPDLEPGIKVTPADETADKMNINHFAEEIKDIVNSNMDSSNFSDESSETNEEISAFIVNSESQETNDEDDVKANTKEIENIEIIEDEDSALHQNIGTDGLDTRMVTNSNIEDIETVEVNHNQSVVGVEGKENSENRGDSEQKIEGTSEEESLELENESEYEDESTDNGRNEPEKHDDISKEMGEQTTRPSVSEGDVFKFDNKENEINIQDKNEKLSAMVKNAIECKIKCSTEQNEICDTSGSFGKCICKRGFARLDDSAVCERAYTYNISMVLESLNGNSLQYSDTYEDKSKQHFIKLSNLVKRGLDSTFMDSELASVYRGVELVDVKEDKKKDSEGIRVDMLIFVKASDEVNLDDVKTAVSNGVESRNFELDGEVIEPSRQTRGSLVAEDFDECLHDMHDCPTNANCINLNGTFTCQCKEGYEDLNSNTTDVTLKGRVCAGAVQVCKECNFAGSCKFDAKQNFVGCECREWYGGETCGINLKVLMIALIVVGSLLLLLIACGILICCLRTRRAKGAISSGPSFLRYKGPGLPSGTLDRTAIIRGDASSESSGGGLDNHGHSGDKALRSTPPNSTTSPVAGLQAYRPYGEGVGMLIPRAKHQHVTSYPTQPNLALTPEELAAREHQLIEYLEKGRGKRARLPSSARNTLERPAPSTFRRGSDGGLANRSRSVDALSNVSESIHGDRISEVRSYDETTVRPAMKTPPYKNSKYEVASRTGSRYGTTSSRDALYKPSHSTDDASQFDSL